MKHQLSSTPGNHILLSVFELDLFGYFLLVESQNVCPFLVWFVLLNVMTTRLIHILALPELPSFEVWIIFHCVNAECVYGVLCPWRVGVLPSSVHQCE